MTTAVADGVVDIEYDVHTEAPEEDEYIVARALADFIPEEEGRFIALEVNAPVFIFVKHASGWWTGECKGKYGLLPSNFVSEEFHVTLRPKTTGLEGEAFETGNRTIPVVAEGNESSSEGFDDDTDSDEEDSDEEEDEVEETANPNGSPPIAIPTSALATPDKNSVPHLSIPSSSDSFLSDSSKLTPVSRQLGEFVDRLNESARTPTSSTSSNPTTPTRLGMSPRFSTPLSSTPRKGSVRAHRVDSLGDMMVMDPETSKLTPVSRQLGEFVDRLNQSRTSMDVINANSSIGKGKGTRNGEPIFNVFDGLLADIESLRTTGPLEGEWDDAEDVYNTPEAARARIAIDVKALRDELEFANSARISVESDIVRLREELTAQLEVERKGRIILEKKLSEREIIRPRPVGEAATAHPALTESKYTETDPEINPLQQELDESKAKNRMLEKELENLQQTMFNLQKESAGSLQRNMGERNEVAQELERQMIVNKQLETELKRMTEELKKHEGQNIQDVEQKQSEEIKILRAEVEALRAEKDQFEKQSAEQIRIAKEQVAHQKDEIFFVEREQLIQQKFDLMQVELRKLREREEERTKSALDDRSKQLDAVIAAHEETRKRLELERDQAREKEAATAKELEELKVKYQKQKELPPKPPKAESKVIQAAEPQVTDAKPAVTHVGQSQPVPTQDTHAPPAITIATTGLVHEPAHPIPVAQPQRVAAGRTGHSSPSLQSDQLKQPHEKRRDSQPEVDHPTSATTVVAHEPPPQIPVQNIAVASRIGHSAPSLQSDQLKQPQTKRSGSQLEMVDRHPTSMPDTTPKTVSDTTPKNMQRAVSHGAVPTSHLGAVRPPGAATPLRAPGLAPRPPERSVSPNSPRDDAPTTDTHASEGPRRLAVAPPSSTVRRTIANRPSEDNSLESNLLFQQRRLSAQVLEYTPTQPPQAQSQPPHTQSQPPHTQAQPPHTQAQPSQSQQSQTHPVLRRAAASLPSVPNMKD